MNTAPNEGHPALVYNNIFYGGKGSSLEATATADITENHNTFYGMGTARTLKAHGVVQFQLCPFRVLVPFSPFPAVEASTAPIARVIWE